MRSDRVEISQQDALDRRSGVYIVADDLLGDLLGVAEGRSGRLDGGCLIDRILVRLAIDGATRREYEPLDAILRH